jgi:carbonic anhydrase
MNVGALVAPAALESLRRGNARFATGTGNRFATEEAERRRELVARQTPSTIVLACSDSRVAPAVVFDQGLGDLFVIRVAGNVVAPEMLGSIEFAADGLGARLVVVLGHTGCGAIAATLDEVQDPSPNPSPNLGAIIDRIRPSVESVLQTADPANRDDILARSVRVNVSASVTALRAESAVVDRLVRCDGLVIVGAEYSLQTGVVDFFETSA